MITIMLMVVVMLKVIFARCASRRRRRRVACPPTRRPCCRRGQTWTSRWTTTRWRRGEAIPPLGMSHNQLSFAHDVLRILVTRKYIHLTILPLWGCLFRSMKRILGKNSPERANNMAFQGLGCEPYPTRAFRQRGCRHDMSGYLCRSSSKGNCVNFDADWIQIGFPGHSTLTSWKTVTRKNTLKLSPQEQNLQ